MKKLCLLFVSVALAGCGTATGPVSAETPDSNTGDSDDSSVIVVDSSDDSNMTAEADPTMDGDFLKDAVISDVSSEDGCEPVDCDWTEKHCQEWCEHLAKDDHEFQQCMHECHNERERCDEDNDHCGCHK